MQHKKQIAFHAGPFGFNDTVYDGVSNCTIRHDPVIPQDSILLRTQPFNRTAGWKVQTMGPEFNGKTFHGLKCMLKK